MSTITHVAHCGACSARMVLVIDDLGCYFVCCECGEETTPRTTAAEAGEDVVWVAVRARRKDEG